MGAVVPFTKEGKSNAGPVGAGGSAGACTGAAGVCTGAVGADGAGTVGTVGAVGTTTGEDVVVVVGVGATAGLASGTVGTMADGMEMGGSVCRLSERKVTSTTRSVLLRLSTNEFPCNANCTAFFTAVSKASVERKPVATTVANPCPT